MKLIKIEDVTAGAQLDQGIFVAREETTHAGAVNPNTWMIRLAGGAGYVESRNAKVRVWNAR
jgi:hypothetical protein